MSTSPPPKRVRLSSPTFEDQVGELSQDDIDAFDAIDAQFSQSITNPVEDDENPFQATQTSRIHPPFTSASAFDRSSEQETEDEVPPQVDYAAWFNPNPTNSFVGFTAAATAVSGFQRPSAKGVSAKSFFVPSAAALRDAEEKLRKWQEEVPDQPPTRNEPDSHHSTQMMSPPRATSSSTRNAYSSTHAPETPTPTSCFRSANVEPIPSKSHSSFQSLGGKQQTKPFKSPLIGTTPSVPSHRQSSTPSIGSPLRMYNPTVPFQLTPAVSPLRPSSVANQVATQKALGFTPRYGNATTKPKFVTPFKTAPKASVLENIKLPLTPSNPKTIVNRVYPPSVTSSPRPNKRNSDGRKFDLSEHRLWTSKIPARNSTFILALTPGRQTLAASSLRPQAHTAEQLEDMGMSVFVPLGRPIYPDSLSQKFQGTWSSEYSDSPLLHFHHPFPLSSKSTRSVLVTRHRPHSCAGRTTRKGLHACETSMG